MPQSALSFAVLAMVALFASQAVAQEPNPLVRERIQIAETPSRSGQVRVQTSVNLMLPGPSGEGDAADQLRDRARRMIYQLAARECGVLEDVIARTCRLEAINVNLNRQVIPGVSGEGYMVAGNMTMMITLK